MYLCICVYTYVCMYVCVHVCIARYLAVAASFSPRHNRVYMKTCVQERLHDQVPHMPIMRATRHFPSKLFLFPKKPSLRNTAFVASPADDTPTPTIGSIQDVEYKNIAHLFICYTTMALQETIHTSTNTEKHKKKTFDTCCARQNYPS